MTDENVTQVVFSVDVYCFTTYTSMLLLHFFHLFLGCEAMGWAHVARLATLWSN